MQDMEKEWEMIFDLEWCEHRQEMAPKDEGHQLDDKTTNQIEQYMGVTPRGITNEGTNCWEPTLTIVIARSLAGREKEQKQATDIREMKHNSQKKK
jgi:hypothetical protein